MSVQCSLDQSCYCKTQPLSGFSVLVSGFVLAAAGAHRMWEGCVFLPRQPPALCLLDLCALLSSFDVFL